MTLNSPKHLGCTSTRMLRLPVSGTNPESLATNQGFPPKKGFSGDKSHMKFMFTGLLTFKVIPSFDRTLSNATIGFFDITQGSIEIGVDIRVNTGFI